MNKRGVTIIELLISITIIAVVVILLLKVIMSLDRINNDPSYASSDEINRTTIIKTIEEDFLEEKLQGLKVKKNNDEVRIILEYQDKNKELVIKEEKLIYDKERFTLQSKGAKYKICPKIEVKMLDEAYYLLKIQIEVVIEGVNTTIDDDIELTYIGLNKDNDFQLLDKC